MASFRPALILCCLLALPAGAWAQSAGPLRCFVSIPPQAWFLERLGGQLVEVKVLAPPGASPHTFEPTPRQVAALGLAQVYFSLGLPFEQKMLPRARAASPGLKVVDTAKGVALRRLSDEEEEFEEAGHNKDGNRHGGEAGGHGEPDPHFWLSPAQAQIMAANLARGLEEADPVHAGAYAANLGRLVEVIKALDRRLAEVLAPHKGGEFLVYHPAFGYLGEAYGLRQVPVEIGGKEPGPRRLARLIDLARARGVKVVFVQPQFPAASARRLAEAIGGAVVPLDPLARDWAANLEGMARALESGVRDSRQGLQDR